MSEFSSHYDVIIAGGGPSGASAAYFLTRAGKRVLLLEKATLPRYKACGGGVSLEYLQSQFPFDFQPVIDRFATHFQYHFNGLEVPVRCRPNAMALVRREALDQLLMQQSGADVICGEAVRHVHQQAEGITVETSQGRQFSADWLIGADGANSIVRHEAGFATHHKIIHAVEAEVTPEPEVMQRFASGPVFIFDKMRYGYLWIFPKASQLSVGAAGFNPKPGYLSALLKKVMQGYDINLTGVQLHAHPLPVYIRHTPVVARKVLLVGDAAGLIDPFSGEGIRLAIKSGRIAAEAILAEDGSLYQTRIQREIGFDRLASWWVSQFFYPLRFLCLLFGAPNPFTTDLVMDLLADRTNTLKLMALAIATLPAFLAIEIAGMFVGLFGGKQKRIRFLSSMYPYSQ